MSLTRPTILIVCTVLCFAAQGLTAALSLQARCAQPPATPTEAWQRIDQLLAQWQVLRQSHTGVSLTNLPSRARAGENPGGPVRALIADAEADGFFTLLSEVAAFGLQSSAAGPPASDPVALRYLVQAASARAWIALFDNELSRAVNATADLLGLAALMYLQSDDMTILMAGASEEFAHALAHEIFVRAGHAAELAPLRSALAFCEARAEPRSVILRVAASRARVAYDLDAAAPLPAHTTYLVDALGAVADLAPWQRAESVAQFAFQEHLNALLASNDIADRAFASEVRNLQRALDVLERASGIRRGLIILGALRSRALTTGSYPAALTDLVPDDLETLPSDLYADGPFLYARSPDGQSMALWSVGLDSIDNDRHCPRGLMTGLRTRDAGHDCVFWTAP